MDSSFSLAGLPTSPKKRVRVECRCGSESCRKYLFWQRAVDNIVFKKKWELYTFSIFFCGLLSTSNILTCQYFKTKWDRFPVWTSALNSFIVKFWLYNLPLQLIVFKPALKCSFTDFYVMSAWGLVFLLVTIHRCQCSSERLLHAEIKLKQTCISFTLQHCKGWLFNICNFGSNISKQVWGTTNWHAMCLGIGLTWPRHNWNVYFYRTLIGLIAMWGMTRERVFFLLECWNTIYLFCQVYNINYILLQLSLRIFEVTLQFMSWMFILQMSYWISKHYFVICHACCLLWFC